MRKISTDNKNNKRSDFVSIDERIASKRERQRINTIRYRNKLKKKGYVKLDTYVKKNKKKEIIDFIEDKNND